MGGSGFAAVVGRIAEGHSYTDVSAAVNQGVTTAPPWLSVGGVVDVPNSSQWRRFADRSDPPFRPSARVTLLVITGGLLGVL